MSLDYFTYCPALLKLLREGAATGATGQVFESLPSLSTLSNLHVLRELIFEAKPKDTLEIGLAFGGSALTFLASLNEVSPDRAYSHAAIDPCQKTVWDNVALKLIQEAGFAKQFTFIENFSCYALPELMKEERRYGLIYVDGSHLFEDVFVDMYFVRELLRENGIVVFDDCLDPHVAKVMKFVKSNYNEMLTEIDLRKYAGPKPLMKRLANALGYRQVRGFKKIGQRRREWNSSFSRF